MVKLSYKINQIYKKVDSIAKKGKDGYIDYSIYLEELVNQGEWYLFEDMMLKKYQIDIRQYKSVNDVKSKTFERIRFFTLDDFQTDIKNLYSLKGVYQNGFNIYQLSNDQEIGKIYEVEVVTENYPMYKETELAIREKLIIINLEVYKESDGSTTLIDSDTTLIDKYKAAIDLLLAV